MATVELSEVLSREKLRGITMVDTENLITLVVAMQKAQEKDWLETYETIGQVTKRLPIKDVPWTPLKAWYGAKISVGSTLRVVSTDCCQGQECGQPTALLPSHQQRPRR